MSTINIALDAMGGDHGPSVTVPAAIGSIKRHHQLHISLVGDQAILSTELKKYSGFDSTRLTIVPTTEVINMEDKPAYALRRKRNSSMHKVVDLVRQDLAQACVSAGNTGALMAIGLFSLKTLPGIDRPAIVTALPTLSGHCYLLDIGANVDCRSEYLHQFAVMGSALARALDNIEHPTVGLLNIGQELTKGNEQVKLAAQLLETSEMINYYGFIEADKLFHDTVNVVVCDGFVGNIALKTCEGISDVIISWLEYKIRTSSWWRLYKPFLSELLYSLRNQFEQKRFNGASLIGLQGIVVKSHGKADITAMEFAIDHALLEIKNNIPEQINIDLEKII